MAQQKLEGWIEVEEETKKFVRHSTENLTLRASDGSISRLIEKLTKTNKKGKGFSERERRIKMREFVLKRMKIKKYDMSEQELEGHLNKLFEDIFKEKWDDREKPTKASGKIPMPKAEETPAPTEASIDTSTAEV